MAQLFERLGLRKDGYKMVHQKFRDLLAGIPHFITPKDPEFTQTWETIKHDEHNEAVVLILKSSEFQPVSVVTAFAKQYRLGFELLECGRGAGGYWWKYADVVR